MQWLFSFSIDCGCVLSGEVRPSVESWRRKEYCRRHYQYNNVRESVSSTCSLAGLLCVAYFSSPTWVHTDTKLSVSLLFYLFKSKSDFITYTTHVWHRLIKVGNDTLCHLKKGKKLNYIWWKCDLKGSLLTPKVLFGQVLYSRHTCSLKNDKMTLFYLILFSRHVL